MDSIYIIKGKTVIVDPIFYFIVIKYISIVSDMAFGQIFSADWLKTNFLLIIYI